VEQYKATSQPVSGAIYSNQSTNQWSNIKQPVNQSVEQFIATSQPVSGAIYSNQSTILWSNI